MPYSYNHTEKADTLKVKSPTFINELPLVTNRGIEKELDIRLNSARMLYNACLGEALKRNKKMKNHPSWIAARPMEKSKTRNALFSEATEAACFSEYSLQSYAVGAKNACWIGDHLDVHVVQKIASRAFTAVKTYSIGLRGKPRFKSIGRMSSLEGKNNASGIRWRGDHVEWFGLSIKAIFAKTDKFSVETYALMSEVKYVRLIKRVVKGKDRWFVQLVLKGTPAVKRAYLDGVTGLDIGPSTIAIVTDWHAQLLEFCPEIDVPYQRIRVIQRAMDRSKRAMNSDNFNDNGTVKKRNQIKEWKFSTNYLELKAELKELYRVMAAIRERSQNRLANTILQQGTDIKTEKVSYKGWQKLYGKSIGKKAPGMFVATLKRKAENAGGQVTEFPTVTTKLSQTCVCGKGVKKKLSERWHICDCGVTAQRDLFSAYLARYVENKKLDTRKALTGWPGVHLLLEWTVSQLQETANDGVYPASFGIRKNGNQRQSCSSIKGLHPDTTALQVTPLKGKVTGLCLSRTP